jgi:hypothetical protein
MEMPLTCKQSFLNIPAAVITKFSYGIVVENGDLEEKRWESKIKMDLREMDNKGREWMELVQDHV